METVLSGMISSLALPPAPPPPRQSAPMELAGHHQMDTAGTPTPPNSSTSTSTSTSLAIQTPSATSPLTNSSTPGPTHPVPMAQMASPTVGGAHQQQQQPNGPGQRTSRTFFRPPGLGPEGNEGGEQFPTNVMVCPHCGFSCSSKFHYNSHMNTHTTHQCSMCNYQSRTEGRLKKHMQQSHTHEQRVAVGISISPTPPPPAPPPGQNSPRSGEEERPSQCRPVADNPAIPTSIAPFLNSMLSDHPANGSLGLDSFHSMLNGGGEHLSQFSSNSTDALLKICTDAISNNGPNEKAYSSPQMGDLGPTALDQLRALAERQAANLLATSTANALGFVGELQMGQEGTMIGGGGGEPKKQETPRRSGKPKQYKCKQCQHISRSKKEQWAHARLHIPKQKQLTCELCDFVTEYKHHLEYHYRNHNGQKPFKCNTCAYTCVNKSMLNSHMKSHTPVYQFRCQDCTYQTKYCHSLKMHLKKYAHKRAPGIGGSDSSDSHGEERPENASSSSVGKDESFENGGAPSQGHSGGEMAEGGELAAMHSMAAQQHALMMGQHQPMGGEHEMDMTSQRFLLQQQLQLEQMNELIRNAVVNCPHCSFSTGNIDEMNRHLLFHLIATQQQIPPLSNEHQALASIYQRVAAQLQQELAPDGPMLGHQDPSILLGQAMAAASHGQQNGELDKARQMEREAAESIRHQQQAQQHHAHAHPQHQHQFPPTPTTIAALLGGGNEMGGTASGTDCSRGTPGSSEPGPSSSSSGAMKKEFQQFGLVEGMAQGRASNGAGQETESSHRPPSGSCAALRNAAMPRLAPPMGGGLSNGNFGEQNGNGPGYCQPNLLNHFPNQANGPGNLPFYCQQCEIAFKNAVLYQLHCGYHSIESAFKCNRCGHVSGSALEFNLHLYQAKHE